MAFVAGAVVVRSSAASAFVSKAPVAVARRPVRSTMTMKVAAPSSEVLGLGKSIPSGLYLLLSVVSLGLGCWSCAQSNIFSPLTAETVNPQFVVGSLLVPISWGCHVASWIQKQNGK
mmetsp:Transcript_13744/g.29745  ORF Transcript_13744/g.29745 Transcript_13744/m.29745 type:complete len:117 (-) Transcript_13744:1510-1860(-)